MDRKIKKMLRLASKAQSNAYAPYSKFKVGACIRSKSGKYYVGANAENSASPEGACAETNAIGAMITAGERHIDTVVVVGPDHKVISPCGGCRQRLAEFSHKTVAIHLFNKKGDEKVMSIEELLPESFKLDK